MNVDEDGCFRGFPHCAQCKRCSETDGWMTVVPTHPWMSPMISAGYVTHRKFVLEEVKIGWPIGLHIILPKKFAVARLLRHETLFRCSCSRTKAVFSFRNNNFNSTARTTDSHALMLMQWLYLSWIQVRKLARLKCNGLDLNISSLFTTSKASTLADQASIGTSCLLERQLSLFLNNHLVHFFSSLTVSAGATDTKLVLRVAAFNKKKRTLNAKVRGIQK